MLNLVLLINAICFNSLTLSSVDRPSTISEHYLQTRGKKFWDANNVYTCAQQNFHKVIIMRNKIQGLMFD